MKVSTDPVQKLKEIDGSSKIHSRLNGQSIMWNWDLEQSTTTNQPNDDITPICDHLFKHGYVVVPDMLNKEQVDEFKKITLEFLDSTPAGRNSFEGLTTRRVYGLLTKDKKYQELLLLPKLQQILDRLLYKNYLLTGYQCIDILPKEIQQALHFDDQYVLMPRPRPYTGIALIWAIDQFTKENGATRVFPDSHTWPQGRTPTKDDPIIPMEMKPGSALILLSTTWHAGGANSTDRNRLAITAQFCQPWIRTQENQFLSVPFDMVLHLPPKLQSMLGYSIHFPFIGHSNGLHPLKALKNKL